MVQLRSKAFEDGERIPDKYTCNGENFSPPLTWSKASSDIKSWALILDDPDASSSVFTHWVIFNIPADTTSLAEAVPTVERPDNGALQGKNDTGKTGYSGPCPPPGPVHHYNFSLYALDKMLKLPAGASKKQVQDSMKGHIVVQGKLTGVYGR
jgi:Raf kinase inhibitor-like YbhB/YbcL family protein